MPHILNKITGVKLEDIKNQLETDAAGHAEHGMYLEHLWRNADDPDEIFFLFRVNDLGYCKNLMQEIYREARDEDPNIKMPEKIFLEEE
ncbi:MAG: hypothetical protein JXR26_03420 [Balneolaceae bacterium]|nr:hypothetical protein [Balneolaceae bacterium]